MIMNFVIVTNLERLTPRITNLAEGYNPEPITLGSGHQKYISKCYEAHRKTYRVNFIRKLSNLFRKIMCNEVNKVT
jgi:hypothetical protein